MHYLCTQIYWGFTILITLFKGHTCPTCGKNYPSKGEVNKHIRIVHEGIRFECELCKKKYISKQALNIHFETTHEGKKPDVKCPMCEKMFGNKQVLKRHIDNVHEKKKPFACDLCDWRFAQSGQLTTHKKGKHKIDC